MGRAHSTEHSICMVSMTRCFPPGRLVDFVSTPKYSHTAQCYGLGTHEPQLGVIHSHTSLYLRERKGGDPFPYPCSALPGGRVFSGERKKTQSLPKVCPLVPLMCYFQGVASRKCELYVATSFHSGTIARSSALGCKSH